MVAADETKYPMRSLVNAWIEKITLAEKFKQAKFGNDADIAMKFFHAGKELNEFMWTERLRNPFDDEDDSLPAPRFRILVAKVAELVQLFGPSLYHRNPTIIVEPKTLDIPTDLLMQMVPPETLQAAQMEAQQRGQQFDPASLFPPDPEEAGNKLTALLLQYYLDYMQRENDKKTQSRRMIDEALIKGMGLCWTEEYQPYEGGPKLIGSFYDTVDNFLIDPDAETLEDAWWIARRCRKPIWEVAKKYKISESFLNKKYGTAESLDQQALLVGDADSRRKRDNGETNDLIEYWEIYSRMGMGTNLSKIKIMPDEVEDMLESFGMNCMIVVAKKVPFPLNLHHRIVEDALTEPDEEEAESKNDEAFMSVQWPIPFWADGTWPCTPCAFHEVPNSPWPMSHIKPGLGYVEFMTWCMSFMANKIRTSGCTIVSCMKSLDDELKAEIKSGKDFRLLEIPANLVQNGDVKNAVHVLQFPEVNKDLWQILEACAESFDKSTGLSEMMYAASGGIRSAQEASVKQGAMSIRPDDMASKVEDCMSLIARKEAMAARWLLKSPEVEPVLGKRGAALWENYVQSGDVTKVAREFHYRVEAGSSRKPNKETRVQQINQALQQWLPIIGPWALQTGNHQIINAFLADWGQAMDVETKKYLLPPPPPPQPSPEAQKAQAEIQMKQEELQLKKEEWQAKLAMEQQKNQMELQAQQAQTEADVQQAQMEMQIDREKAQQELQLGQAKMHGDMQLQQQKMGLEAEKGRMDLALAQQQGKQQLQLGAMQGLQSLKINEATTDAKIQQMRKTEAAKPKKDTKKK